MSIIKRLEKGSSLTHEEMDNNFTELERGITSDDYFGITLEGTKSDSYGETVSINSNKIVVGAYRDNSDRGAVYTYDLDGTNEVKIVASDGVSSDNFGVSTTINDTKIAVGAYGTNSFKGAVYTYDLDGTNEVKIVASDGASSDKFGRSLCSNSTKIVVGANGNTGAVYTYDLDGTNEVKITRETLKIQGWGGVGGSSYNNPLGEKVAVNQTTIAIGMPSEKPYIGEVFLLNMDGSNFYRFAPDGELLSGVGVNVSMNSDTMLVGTYVGVAYLKKIKGTKERYFGKSFLTDKIITLKNVPTTDPIAEGIVWNNNGVLSISIGSSSSSSSS